MAIKNSYKTIENKNSTKDYGGRQGYMSAGFTQKIFLVLLCLTTGFFGGILGSKNNAKLGDGSITANRQIIASESQLINEIVKNVGPSVVSVNVTSETPTNSFFGNRSLEQQSAGTGVIISKEGVVITNRHVIPQGAKDISVTLSDGTTLDDVQVIGRTNDNDSLDIAFLKIKDAKGKTLKPATLADSSKVKVGDKVVAIGNALGQFQNTVTSGIISGFGRSVQAGSSDGTETETLQNLFQTDTAINQGNSGGPLVNTSGEVVAINTAVAGNAENIGFAIPVNDIQGLIKSVLKDGKLLRPYLGVRYISLNDNSAEQLNLSTKRGAYIAPSDGQETILEGSPAQKAGLKEKDIIVKIDDATIDENNSLTSVLGRHSVGDNIDVYIIRDGKEQKLRATLEASPQQQ